MGAALSKAKAKEQMVKSVRDLETVKITLPLGNPNLKLVHTNQMLFTELPEEVFELANFDAIAEALNSKYTRYSGYVLNRWYIQGRKITNDGKTAKMELELNPFPSDVLKFREEKNSFTKAYTDATSSNTAKTSNSKTNKTKVKSTTRKVDIPKAINEVGKLMEKKKYKRYTFSDYKNFVKYGYGDCWAGAYFVACELEKRGVPTRILNYPTSASSNHRSVQYKDSKGWKNFPYKKFKIHSWFHAYSSKGKIIPNNCPKKM